MSDKDNNSGNGGIDVMGCSRQKTGHSLFRSSVNFEQERKWSREEYRGTLMAILSLSLPMAGSGSFVVDDMSLL